MKKIILIILLAQYGFNAMAQVKIGDNLNTINANSVLELESTNKGLRQSRVALTATTNAAPLTAHVQGMVVYNTATTGDVTPGIYVNDGTKWAPLNRSASDATVSAVCNGFTGTYTPGASARTFTVTYTNNSFTTASVTPAVGDLVLSPASGLTVASVSPNTATTINSGTTRLVTYTLGGSLSAIPGTVITGTFTKFGLKCARTVAVPNNAPVANAGNEQDFNYTTASSFNLSGSATDDGVIASYAWTRTGGTGASTPTINSPSSTNTTVTGVTTSGTYIFTLTVTDNAGLTGTATVTITASNITSSAVAGPNGTTFKFMAHNLGSDYSLNPLIPAKGLSGHYYQWGRLTPAATVDTPPEAIIGWNTSTAASNAWNSGTEEAPVKTANDPCPDGYRVPTNTEFEAMLYSDGNTASYIGTFTQGYANFTSGIQINTDGIPKLFFPASGYRKNDDGSLQTRNSQGSYNSSSYDSRFGGTGGQLVFVNGGISTIFHAPAEADTIKCIKQ